MTTSPEVLSLPVGVPNDLPVMYSIMILHETGKPITAGSIESIILAAGMTPSVDDIAHWLWIEQELEDADIDMLMTPREEHPIQIIEDLMPSEPEPEVEEEEEPDVWTRLFG